MKTLKKQISTIMLLIGITFITNGHAQKPTIETGMFVRVYNLEGKKISKGKLIEVSDTLLIIKSNGKFNNLDSKQIGYIKTKRSAGHNALMGAAIGATVTSIISVASINPDDGFIIDSTPNSFGEAMVVGVVGGGIVGSAIGAITIPLKNTNKFIINGDESNWKAFKTNFKNSEVNNGIN